MRCDQALGRAQAVGRPIRFAIVGCGRIAQRHAEHIRTRGCLVAVCDVIAARAETLAATTGARCHYSVEDMLAHVEAVDVVAICTPNGLHAIHTIKALSAGHHVLCEKPLAITTRDCAHMIKTAETMNRHLFVVKQNRFNPPVVAVKHAIDGGHLGRLYSVQLSCFWNRDEAYYSEPWRGTKTLDGGTLFTQFSHFIDLLHWMVGDVRRVHAFGANFAHRGMIEFEDAGVVALEFENGVLGTINYSVNSYQRNMEGSLTILAERGSVKIGGQYLNELEYEAIQNFTIGELPPGKRANNYGTYEGSMSNHDKVYDNVVDVLQNGGRMSASAHDGLKTVETIERIYAAMLEGSDAQACSQTAIVKW